MATYTHFELVPPNLVAWDDVIGSSYSFTASTITFQNVDFPKTLTRAHGSFVIIQGNLVGGVITTLERTSADGTTVYESITGLALDANLFHGAAMHDKLSLALAGVDILYGYSGDDHLSGGAQNDQLYGGDGDDWLDGGTGADFMVGGRHDDTYYVDNAGDVVIEKPDQGFDRVFVKTLASYTLGADVELLEFLQAGTHTGTGNALDNWLRGNFGQDTLYGLGGNDHFEGFSGGDTLIGGEGDDDYAVHPGDAVLELPGQGIDKVRTGLASYTLPDNVENLETYGDIGIGNALDNVIRKQDAGYAELYGLEGNDTLYHNWPGDGLVDGGAGDDTAVFGGNLADWSILDRGDKVFLTSGATHVRAIGIEHLTFNDGTIDFADGNGLFDTIFYMRGNLDVFHAGANALDHYNAFGWHEGRDPNSKFSTLGYLGVNPDVAASGMNPLDHYHQVGWQQGRDPGMWFDTTRYLQHNPDVAAAGIDPLQHYLMFGMAEGRAAFQAIGQSIVGGFDAEYYLWHNPDVAAAGVDPLAHFNAFGWHEGRNPNTWFDTAGYLAHYADIAAAGVNPLEHYEQFGWKEGRDPSAFFDTLGYLAANPDVTAAGVNPLDHFLTSGIYEERKVVNDGVWH
jgi:Ca2+-binding RTX toxin-like protein